MNNNILRDAEGCAARRHRSRIWKRVVCVLACAVVFGTAYALILPAITMEKEVCSLPEHTHTEECRITAQEDGAAIARINMLTADRNPVRLYQYAEEHGGEVKITVSDNGVVLSPNPDTGEYDVTEDKTYNVRVAYQNNNGLPVGKYYVTFAANVNLNQTGKLSFIDNQGNTVDAGSWYFQEKDGGSAWLIFDISQAMDDYSHVTLVADVACQFAYTNESVEFDGNIKVNVKRDEDTTETEVSKWASSSQENPQAGKIYWRSEIYGNSGSVIVGNTLTDTLTTKTTHYYTTEDMNAGITFKATLYSGSFSDSNNRVESHYWTVKKGDSNLTWTESGWNYTMPETITCTDCGRIITLGNDNWLYYLKYTSTMKDGLGDGYVTYENKIAIDGDEATASTHTGKQESTGKVVKTGVYHAAEDGELYTNDTVDWTLTVTIPGARSGKQFDYFWYLWDSLKVEQGSTDIKYANPLNNVTVTAKMDDKTFIVPKYGDEGYTGAPICRSNDWTGSEDGVAYGQEIDFYCKCTCSKATCACWNAEKQKCRDAKGDFCRCWSIAEDVVITFQYSTPAGELAGTYGRRGSALANSVTLNNKQLDENNEFHSVDVSYSKAEVPIPGVFTKEQTGDPKEENGYLAEYTITVNEAKADLSSLQELTITDTMSKTLNFLSATLTIQAQDSQGSVRKLVKNQDYTVVYDSSGTSENTLTMVLMKDALGPYQYTLLYDAGVSGGTSGTTYKNTAEITLSGKTYTVGGEVHEVPQAVMSASTYGATLKKCDSDTGEALSGAVFCLYAAGSDPIEEGTPLYEHYVTGDNGIVQIKTAPGDGVILYPHVLYYVQETKAPDGYQPDTTKHYFWFCDNNDVVTCSKSNAFARYTATCIYSLKTNEETIDLTIYNSAINGGHRLPDTGGSGTIPYTVGGLVLVISTGAILMTQYRKRRRTDS